jgi:hypothetical protein
MKGKVVSVTALDFSGHKVCKTCGSNTYYTDYYTNKKSKDGLQANCKKCHSKKIKQRYNPRKRKSYSLKYNYGITLEEYERKLENQDFGCAICGIKIPGGNGKHFYVDHNHTTGQVRDLLCHNCNFVIGYAKEDTDILQAVIRYLEIWGDEPLQR